MAGPIGSAPLALSIDAHLIALPVLIPLIAGALAAAVGGRSRTLSRFIGMVAMLAHLAVAVQLYLLSQTDLIHVYAMGNWAAPFGIVLVLDRLSATMVLLTSVLGFLGLLYANAAWSAEGRRFQALWQFQLMGLSGAFLTSDLFNLFVFFEVLLAASYALLLHGGGRARVGATLHFVVINLTASGVFLIAIATLYSITGTLNMAHMSEVIANVGAEDVSLVAVAGILLLTVFLIKSGLVPFHFWVPASYGSAAAPVVALVVAKVGAYSIVRVFPLLFGPFDGEAGAPAEVLAELARPWVIGLALLTLAVGAAGALAAQTLRQLAAMLTLISIGTLFLPVGVANAVSLSAASYYLMHSTIATAMLFLVAEWVGTHRGEQGDRLRPGRPISHPILIGGALLWAMVTSVGLPPTSGFIGKLMVLDSLGHDPLVGWLWTAILVSSFCALVAVSRALSLLLWNSAADEPGYEAQQTRPASTATLEQQEHLLTPVQGGDVRAIGAVVATVGALLLSGFMVTHAGPLREQTDRLGEQIMHRDGYRNAVLGRAREQFEPLLRPSPAAAGGGQ